MPTERCDFAIDATVRHRSESRLARRVGIAQQAAERVELRGRSCSGCVLGYGAVHDAAMIYDGLTENRARQAPYRNIVRHRVGHRTHEYDILEIEVLDGGVLNRSEKPHGHRSTLGRHLRQVHIQVLDGVAIAIERSLEAMRACILERVRIADDGIVCRI